VVEYKGYDPDNDLIRIYDEYPFVPKNEQERAKRSEEILTIQAVGLAKRLKTTGIKRCVIGISGGLDSTLAFLVVIKAYKILGLDPKDIYGITMPGFGTTNRTYENACEFVKLYGATLKEVNIKDACLQHFKDIDHDPKELDVTYENVQARERTQILMDYANKIGGLVIGTGDLSELAIGWCTYNGDHMSMYAVNTSIPKTLVRYLVNYYADTEESEKCQKILKDILDTPVSPELLPPSESGEILQQTESIVGPYVLHDFFLYHFLRYGASPEKVKFLAVNAFFNSFDEETIEKWLKFFIKRFFSQQFKRSCIPDGPKVGTISLSPRGDLRMPSDADSSNWLNF
ncbi:MAG: NAD(+) synthase, partial [Bacilli bacterium]|nr:NAD(+) synthase [Bacilli bacterium]